MLSGSKFSLLAKYWTNGLAIWSHCSRPKIYTKYTFTALATGRERIDKLGQICKLPKPVLSSWTNESRDVDVLECYDNSEIAFSLRNMRFDVVVLKTKLF